MKMSDFDKMYIKIKTHEFEALSSIYIYRCLNREQLSKMHYEGVNERMISRSLNYFVKNGFLEEVIYVVKRPIPEERMTYFLTNKGIDVVRIYMDLPVNKYNPRRKSIKRGYYTSMELKINPKNINHQIHLNEFVVNFLIQNKNLNYEYKDEKFVSQFRGIRPDGMLTIGNVDYFLEMDMNTESKKQLASKWENYRVFMNSDEYVFKKNNIVVLFICEGTNKPYERGLIVKKTISDEISDKFDHSFNVYVGTTEEMYEILNYHISKQDFNYENPLDMLINLSASNHLYLKKYQFDYLIKESENDVPFDILLDDYRYQEITLVSKYYYGNQIKKEHQNLFNKPFYHALVGRDIIKMWDDFNLYDISFTQNLFFTTEQRLNDYPLSESFLKFDSFGNVYEVNLYNLDKQTFILNVLDEKAKIKELEKEQKKKRDN